MKCRTIVESPSLVARDAAADLAAACSAASQATSGKRSVNERQAVTFVDVAKFAQAPRGDVLHTTGLGPCQGVAVTGTGGTANQIFMAHIGATDLDPAADLTIYVTDAQSQGLQITHAVVYICDPDSLPEEQAEDFGNLLSQANDEVIAEIVKIPNIQLDIITHDWVDTGSIIITNDGSIETFAS